MLIFGGETTKSFSFDTREVSSTTKAAQVNTLRGTLSQRARFGHKSDVVARQFKNFVYAIDSCEKQLHVYQIN